MGGIRAWQALSLVRRVGGSSSRFRLAPWFMAISLALIGLVSLLFATLLSNFLTGQMLHRDAQVSMELVNSIVQVQNATSYFQGADSNAHAPEMEEFFRHVAALPDVIRANVYSDDRTVLWSSDPELIGQTFGENDDLDIAFLGQIAPEIEIEHVGEKDEHIDFPAGVTAFVENYLPIWSEDRTRVVGAIEFYKSPTALLEAIGQGRRFVWIGSGAAGLALYAGLLVIVTRANRVLQRQEARLIETERLAVVGEMASAVAHGLRNPLAAIRSCAELALLDDLPESTRQPIADIVTQTDRLEIWIRSFLTRARENPASAVRLIPLDSVIHDCLSGYSAQMAARGIGHRLEGPDDSLLVAVEASELRQVLNALFANSIEAMEEGGELRVLRKLEAAQTVRISVIDTGKGIPETMKDRLFQPFATGKSSGLGVGLSLSRRIIERIGGTLEIRNAETRGAEVTLRIPGCGPTL